MMKGIVTLGVCAAMNFMGMSYSAADPNSIKSGENHSEDLATTNCYSNVSGDEKSVEEIENAANGTDTKSQ